MIRRRFSTGKSEFNPDKYLTIEALEDGLQISHANGFEYKTDNSGWQRVPQYELTTEINKGEFLYIRARWTTSYGTSFNITRSCNLRGNCLSLLFENDADKHHDISQFPNAFYFLFSRCPINEVASGFLPATTLANNCYSNMFSYTALTTAPDLPATILAKSCYDSIFLSCTNLNYIKMLATDISASGCLNDWVGGVASRGTFVKNKNATWNVTGVSGVPSGWTIQKV